MATRVWVSPALCGCELSIAAVWASDPQPDGKMYQHPASAPGVGNAGKSRNTIQKIEVVSQVRGPGDQVMTALVRYQPPISWQTFVRRTQLWLHGRVRARRATCRRGHKWTPENTRLFRDPKALGGWSRGCRACVAIADGRADFRLTVIARARRALHHAHPDRGGSLDLFLKAHRAYVRAMKAA